MKRIILICSLCLCFLISCDGRELEENLNEESYNDFLELFLTELEEFSHSYDYINDAISEMEKGLFEADREILETTRGRINLVKSDEDAIQIAEIVSPNFFKRKTTDFISKSAHEFGNLWIVAFQVKKHENYKLELDGKSDLFIVISKHTAEVLMFW